MNGITKTVNGQIEWTHEAGDSYLVIGKTVHGQHFRLTFANWYQAKGINLWQGRKYLVRNGKKIKLQEVHN